MKIDGKDIKASGKGLWRIFQAMYYMLKEGIASKQRLISDLKLRLLTLPERIDSMSCHYVDPTKAYYDPKEVQFSCSNTPFYAPKRRSKHYCRNYYGYKNHEAVAKAFEILEAMPAEAESGMLMPSPVWRFRIGSPAVVRKVRVTDSPFPVNQEVGGSGGSGVDREAEDFIRRFYDQLRSQPLLGLD